MTPFPGSLFRAALILLVLLKPAAAWADAIVRTQAMLAPNIAEYFVEADGLRLELEISVQDLDAFRNLLPDEVYEKLGHEPAPLAERLRRFFGNDLVVSVDESPPLPGRIVEMGPRPRLRRDDITGEALPTPEGEETAVSIFVVIEYQLPPSAKSLTFFGLRGPTPASIGFVAYHAGIAVNDFRYLAQTQTLDLDASDPWYSAFRRRALRRQYFAPMSGFLYVEPYEVRKEIVARPSDLQHWVDLGLDGRDTIPVGIQGDLLRTAAAFLAEHQQVRIDGRSIEPELARVNFLERSLRTSRVVDPPVELDLHSAVLGVIFVYPTEGLPQVVTMDWDLWNERIQQIPVAAVDQAGPLPGLLEPDWRVLEWQNFLKNPELPTLRVLAPPPSPVAAAAWSLRWFLLTFLLAGAGASLLGLRRGGDGPRRWALVGTSAVLLMAGTLVWSRDARISNDRAGQIVSALLHNVYRAFDYRNEERIYDVLARSVEGDLLAQIYLETRRGLELASQGGARAKVKEIELVELSAAPADAGSFQADVTWNVAGSVGHWGHVHQRRNQYRAELRVAPVAGDWKLAGLEILEEERL